MRSALASAMRNVQGGPRDLSIPGATTKIEWIVLPFENQSNLLAGVLPAKKNATFCEESVLSSLS